MIKRSNRWLHKHLFTELFRAQIIWKHLNLNKSFAFLIKVILKNNRVHPLMASVLSWRGINTSVNNCVIRTLPIKLLRVEITSLSFWPIRSLTDAGFILPANKRLWRGFWNLDVIVRFDVGLSLGFIPQSNLTFVKFAPLGLDPVI